MPNEHNTAHNLTSPNQPTTREVKNSTTTSKESFKVPSNFIASQYTERYPPDFPIQTTPNPSYTSSLDSPIQNLDSSYNEEIRGLTSEEHVYHVPNSELDQLRLCT